MLDVTDLKRPKKNLRTPKKDGGNSDAIPDLMLEVGLDGTFITIIPIVKILLWSPRIDLWVRNYQKYYLLRLLI
jgi:hypothetical protein